jgi:hypothetical protein
MKKPAKCYIWSAAWHGAETSVFRQTDGRIEKSSLTDLTESEVLRAVK